MGSAEEEDGGADTGGEGAAVVCRCGAEADDGVPEHLMMSEVAFRLGDKNLRADVVVYGRDAKPLAVVECKRPDVELTGDVLMQVVRYNMTLDVKYIFITNGTRTVGFKKDGADALTRLTAFPRYDEMSAK